MVTDRISYSNKYINVYIWQAISVILGFASLFVVIPFLSSDKVLYGVYSVCTSLTIFFSYADLGFLSSGTKYAAEYYIRKELKKEMGMIGFTGFIMLVIFIVFSLGLLFLAFFPKILIPELVDGSHNFEVARWLLVILAFASPAIIGQRILTMVFTIRVEDYKFQRIVVIGSILKILSVFLFFTGGHYDIIGYYLVFQIINVLIVVTGFIYITTYGYNLVDFIKSFRFDKAIFDKVKSLSLTSLIAMVSMIFYYELDQIVISHTLGLEAVSIYAIALAGLQLIRTFQAVLYQPYTSRYNHYAGLKDEESLIDFTRKNIILLTPMLIIPIVTFCLFSKPFVISWVGETYSESALVLSILVLSFIPNFLTNPFNSYFIAKENNYIERRISIIIPIVFWLGVCFTFNSWKLFSFAIFKTVAPFSALLIFFIYNKKQSKKGGPFFVSTIELVKISIVPVLACLLFYYLFDGLTVLEFSRIALAKNIAIMVLVVVGAILFSIFFNKSLRNTVMLYFLNLCTKFKHK